MSYVRLADHVRNAEALAEKNGGLLPVYSDLHKIDQSLASATMKHRDAFAHIPRAKYTKRKADWLAKYVQQAEALAAENGGNLFISHEFQSKHSALTLAIRRNPDAFAHIPRIRRQTKSLNEHIAYAEELAAKNGGVLPASSELRKNHSALRSMMLHHPEAFLHLRKDLLTTPLDEHVSVARTLAEKNGGVLPCGAWLRNNGFWNLQMALYRNPAAFAGIKQEVRVGRRGKVNAVKTFNSADTTEAPVEPTPTNEVQPEPVEAVASAE